MNPIEKYAKLLESLKVKDEGPDKHLDWDFKRDIEILYFSWKELGGLGDEAIEYLFERCRRAEARAIPENLAEDFKEIVRAAMDSVTNRIRITGEEYDEKKFRRLSEPEKANTESPEPETENIYCKDCGVWYDEILVGRGYLGNMDKCPDCGGEWINEKGPEKQ